MRAWNRFFVQYQKDLKLLIFCFLFFQLYRACFIFIFLAHVDKGSSYYNILATVAQGARHDLKIAAIWALIPFICLSIPSAFINMKNISNKIRMWWGAIFTLVAIALSVSSIEYYKEYRDVFNQFLFGIFYDDTSALMSTIIAQYNLGMNLFIVTTVVYIYLRFIRKWIDSEFIYLIDLLKFFRKKSSKESILIYCSIIFLVVSVIFLNTNAAKQEIEEIEEKIDHFLHTAVIPPFKAFNDAIHEFMHIMSQKGINHFLDEKELQSKIKVFFNTKEDYNDIDSYMRRVAKGAKITKKPSHIFIIVMESYDAWSLLEEYSSLKVNSGLKELGKNGILLTNFLPASSSTMATLSAFISGLPDADIRTNYQPSSASPYPSSLPEQFKKLNYKTRFFLSGYPEWHRSAQFFKSQGFEEIYTANDIKNYETKNEWGVDDASLFQFVDAEISEKNEPSLNFILSGSYHAPYSIDLEKQGFKSEEVIGDTKISPYVNSNEKILGHLWYADRELKKFVDQTYKKFPDALFIVTGDHHGRHHIKASPSLYETSIVPLLIYGPNVIRDLDFSKAKAGCHFDIAPTLIELIAEKGFVYHTIGNDLIAPDRETIGISNQKALSKDIMVSTNRFRKRIQYLDDTPDPKQKKAKALIDYGNTAQAISWWRIMHGNEISDQ